MKICKSLRKFADFAKICIFFRKLSGFAKICIFCEKFANLYDNLRILQKVVKICKCLRKFAIVYVFLRKFASFWLFAEICKLSRKRKCKISQKIWKFPQKMQLKKLYFFKKNANFRKNLQFFDFQIFGPPAHKRSQKIQKFSHFRVFAPNQIA